MTKTHKVIFLVFFTILSLILYLIPLSFIFELKSLDLFRKFHSPHPEIVILAVDNQSISKLGRWPWPRSIESQVMEKLKVASPSAVGFDITFSEAGEQKDDAAFVNSIKTANFPVILTEETVFINGSKTPQRFLSPLPELVNLSNVSVGQTFVKTDPDGFNRFFPESLNKELPFSFQIAKVLKADPPQNLDQMINFAGVAGSFPTYSISDLITDQIPSDKLEGKIILIGATASDLHDTVLVPFKNPIMAGVEWQANVLDNILLQNEIKVLPRSVAILISILMGIGYLVFFSKISPRLMSTLIIITTLLFPTISFLLFQFNLAWFFFTAFLLGLILFIFNSIYRWYLAEVEKKRIKQTFKPYFSPVILKTILEDPASLELGGQKKEVTIFFSDIRNFTTITENLPPEKLTSLLQEYFTEMTKAILETNGVVDKFIGDAIMAFWGAPIDQENQADLAVEAALKMIKRLNELQLKWQALGFPKVDIGIGINTGEAIVGNMGSENRFDYTLIGDNVNIASRLEGLNKEYKTSIIISESTKKKLTKKLSLSHLGKVIVKGKTIPVSIYSIKNDN